MNWKSITLKTALVTGGALLVAHPSWASTTGIAAIDTGVNMGANMVQNGLAYAPAVGGAIVAGYSWIKGHSLGVIGGEVFTGGALGGYMHHVGAVNGSFGGATAALIHHADKLTLLAHAIRHLA